MATKSARRHTHTNTCAGLCPGVIEPTALPRRARDSPSLRLPARTHATTFYSSSVRHFLSVLLLTHARASSEGERTEDPKGRAARTLWVGDRIMKGLQRLVGAPFIATVETNMTFFTLIERASAPVQACVPRN